MRIGGRLWKSGKHWLVDVPPLDAMTLGRMGAEAVWMNADLVATMANKEGFSVNVRPGPSGVISSRRRNARGRDAPAKTGEARGCPWWSGVSWPAVLTDVRPPCKMPIDAAADADTDGAPPRGGAPLHLSIAGAVSRPPSA